MCLKLVLKRFTTDERSSVTVTVSHGMHCFLLFIEELGIECQVVKYVFHCVQVLMNIIYYTFPLVKIKSVLKKISNMFSLHVHGLFIFTVFVNTHNIYYIYIYILVHMLYCFFQDAKIEQNNAQFNLIQ